MLQYARNNYLIYNQHFTFVAKVKPGRGQKIRDNASKRAEFAVGRGTDKTVKAAYATLRTVDSLRQ